VPSVVDFVGTVRRMTPGFDPVRFGAEWSKVEEVGLLRGLAERDRLVPPERVIDIHYNEIVADPEGAVVEIYQYFGMDVDEDGRKRIRQFQIDNPQTKHGRHSYAAEDFGLSVEGLRERFGTYIDRFGVEPDRAH
jgi:hypothetical protein